LPIPRPLAREEAMAFHVLMVCTGNTCRSPLAEGILKALLPEERCGRILVSSAGTIGVGGAPATSLAQEVALTHGIDLSAHRSSELTRTGIEGAGLILAMTREHEDDVVALAPGAKARTFLLSEFAGAGRRDVPDPVGGTLEEYEAVYRMLVEHLRKALPRIITLAEEAAS
jgi:protein-tyrosine-phosphatase